MGGLHALNYFPVGKNEQRMWWKKQFVIVTR